MAMISLEAVVSAVVLSQFVFLRLERSLSLKFPAGFSFFKISCVLLTIALASATLGDGGAAGTRYPARDTWLLPPFAVLGAALLAATGSTGAAMYWALCAIEEFVSRAMLLNFLAALPTLVPGADAAASHVFAAGALFAAGHLYHGLPALTFGSGTLALACGALFVASRSLVLCTVLHFYLGLPFIVGGLRDLTSPSYYTSFMGVLRRSRSGGGGGAKQEQ